MEGREEAKVKQCMKAIARTVNETLEAPMSTIRVVVTQIPASMFAVGDQMREEIDAAKAAAAR